MFKPGFINYFSVIINGLLDSLLSYYEFENNVLDSHGSKNGTDNGTSDVAGKILRGRNFDGVNDYIVFPITAFGTNDFSWNMWIKTTSTAVSVLASTAQTNAYMSFISNANGTIGFRKTFSGSQDATSTTAVNDGNWHMITGTMIGQTYKILIDGVLEDTKNRAGSIDGTTLYLGNFSTLIGSVYFPGDVDEFAIYGKVLMQQDIDFLYNSGAGLPYSSFN